MTRPTHQNESLIAALESVGAEAVVVPVIQIGPPPDGGAGLAREVERIDEYDLIAFTSSNAVVAVAGHSSHITIPIAVVGEATARSVEGAGWHVDIRPERSTAADLAAAIGPPSVTGNQMLVPAADIARPELAVTARSLGWSVVVVDAYATVSRRPTDAELVAAASADAICFTSGSTVDGYLDATDQMPGMIVSIGPTTTAALAAQGHEPDAEADPQTVSGMVAALVGLVGSNS